jgi:two-component system cell cycle response regulator DivK
MEQWDIKLPKINQKIEDSVRPPEQEEKHKLSHVLIVEDNAANFYLVARMLEELQIQCEWKTSGFEVVEFADTIPSIDLILMDIMLPYEDGYTALKKIRLSNRLKSVPIIAITALSSEEQMNKALLAGFDGFIGKPLNPDKFPEQIHKVLSGEKVWDLNK